MRCILCYDSRREVKAKMKIDFDWLIMMPLSFLYIGIVFYYVKYKKRKVPYIIVFTLFFTYMAEVLKYTQFPICLNMDMEELNRQCVNYIPFHFLSIEDVENDILIGFTRLRIPSNRVFRKEITSSSSLIRELHVYGQMQKIGKNDDNLWQHKGYGAQ